MRSFKSFFILEFKRFIAWRNAIILILFFSLCMLLVYTGVQQYEGLLESKKEFREIEKEKVEALKNYTRYGLYGIRLLFMPSRLSILFYNSSVFSDLTAHIDVGEKLNIYNSFKGGKIFSARQGKFLDFSGVILLFGSLIAIFYGYDSFRRKEFLKFLSSDYGYKKVFSYIFLSRIILLCSFFFFVIAGAVLILAVNGIHLTDNEYGYLLIFLLVTLVLMVFFYSIGTITGIVESKFARFFIILCWIIYVFILPEALNKTVEWKAKNITDIYRSEFEKLKTLMDFEKDAAKKQAEIRNKLEAVEKNSDEGQEKKDITELGPKSAKNFLKDGFKKIQELEEKLEKQMYVNIEFFDIASMIVPSTFYIEANNEISSKGYENIMNFYSFAKKRKEQFLDFYIKKRYPGKQEQEFESFIGEREKKKAELDDVEANVFSAKSQLPGLSWLGFLLTFLWIIGLFFLSFYLYEKTIFSVKGKRITGLNDFEIAINKGESHVVLASENIRCHLYNVLSGKSEGFSGKVFFNDVNIVEESQKHDFVYICQPEEIPWDIKAADFVSFIGRLSNLSKQELTVINNKLKLKEIGRKNFNKMKVMERGSILFECALLKKCGIYLIVNITKGMPTYFVNEIIDRLEQLKQKGAAILYITNNVFIAKKIGDCMTLFKRDAELMGIRL